MRFESPRPRNSDEERVLPLINVVFLLLIFFMLAGKLAVTDAFEVAPPRSASEAQPQAREMLVLVGADGRLALGDEILEERALQTAVSARVANGDPRIRLKADGRAEAARVVEVMELLREAGVEKLKLLTVAEGG